MNFPLDPHPVRVRKPRILFIGEAISLSHVARPFVLARSLDPALFDVVFACDPRYNRLLGELPFPWRPLRTIPGQRFLEAMAQGKPIYDTATLRGYVEDDLALVREVQPDVVVGDYRLSLTVSAPLTKTCYMTITNAYWSPYARLRYPMPEIRLVRILGVKAASVLFRLGLPFAIANYCSPLNRVRREYGLPSLGSNLRRINTYADYTLYADVPELVPTYDRPDNHKYLGPILWSPAIERPGWWDKVPANRPMIYVTLGSSGESPLLQVVLDALAEMPVTVMAATADRIRVDKLPGNAFVADYLPGEEAAARAAVVISNGGSPTTQQAQRAGKPFLALPSNMDQFLNMEAIQRLGAGEFIRAGKARKSAVRAAVARILDRPEYTAAAQRLSQTMQKYNAGDEFQTLLLRALQVRSQGRPLDGSASAVCCRSA